MKEAPEHLNGRARKFWRAVTADYPLGPDHAELLLRLGEAVTRLDAMRATLDTEGLTSPDRFGQARAHPLVVAEIQTRAQVARMLDQLGLEDDKGAPEIRAGASALARKRWSR